MDKKKLLFVGVSPTAFFSGQGRVARAIVSRLKDFYEIRVAGWGCSSTDFNGIFIYPNSESWWKIISEWNPDVLFLSHDVWRFQQLVDVRQKFKDLIIIGYFTIDGDPISESWIPIFNSCDVILVPSMWGRRVIFERFSQKPIIYIPQGVDLNLFYKVVNKEEIKKIIDSKTKEMNVEENRKFYHSGKFTIFFAGMNQTKKNIGVILDGFDLFAKDKEDVFLVLVLHSHIDNKFGMKVLMDYDFKDLYSWRKSINKFKIIETQLIDEQLLNLYLVSDVLLSPSIGEGFGLFVLEAMATGTIPVISNYSAFRELPHPDAFFLLNVDSFYRSTWNVRRAVVSVNSVCSTLNLAYKNWKEMPEIWKTMQDLNWKRVLQFSWDVCADKIRKIIDQLLNRDDCIDVELRRIL